MIHRPPALVFIFPSLALLSAVAVASEEGVLQLGEFQIQSRGVEQSGPVVITGKQSETEIVALSVQVFGRTINLTKSQLLQLKGQYVNGLQLTYEAGYREVGGRTVYLILSSGFTTGIVTTQLIEINEQGSVKIGVSKSRQDR
jgi:hypothetical protein